MKRTIIFFIVAFCVLSSCDRFKAKDYAEKEKKIEAAKNAALKSIQDERTASIAIAKEAISTATAKAVESAGEDISGAINEAKKEIQSAVDTIVSKSVETKLKASESELGKANKFAAIALLIAIGVILLAVVFVIILLRRTSRDSVVEIVGGSRRIERIIEETVRNQMGNDSRPQVRSSISRADIETEVRRYVDSPAFKQYLVGLCSNCDRPSKAVQGTRPLEKSPINVKPTAQPLSIVPQPKIELFAKDSPNSTLTGVTSAYMQGKSIYKLLLNFQESSTAEITICADREEVKRRILKSSNDLLEPVCVVDRKCSNPEELSAINIIKAGKAEKLSCDSWKVTEPIIVELS